MEEVISSLSARKLLDDERFAELWIRSCLSRKAPSPFWLLVSLGKRGIERHFALKAIEKVLDQETEYALLLRYIEKMDISKKGNKLNLKKQLKHESFSHENINKFFESHFDSM